MNSINENIDYFKYPILFVDDDKDLLYSFYKEFKDTFTIHTAESAKEGLDILEKENITALLVDQRMPAMTGVDLLKIARNKYPQIQRILVTAYSDIEVVIDAINEGKIYGYISKPWKPEELLATIKNAIHLYYLTKERDRLYQEKLDAMKKLARANRLNAAISMASGFSDRVNNYLVAINLFFDTFPQRVEKVGNQLTSDSKEILKSLYEPSKNEVEKMIKLSREMAGFCRPPKYNFQKNDAKVILEIVDEALKTTEPDLKNKEIRIAKEIDGTPPATFFDKDAIKQVLYHLLRNAIHSIPETRKGSILIKVTGPICKSGREFIRITVNDNGVGIPEEDWDNIFNPFFTTKGTAGGLGLGLTTCQFIVTQHDGEIEIAESKLDKGTTINVDLLVRNTPPPTPIDYRELIDKFPNRLR